jgi:hypothetical protein
VAIGLENNLFYKKLHQQHTFFDSKTDSCPETKNYNFGAEGYKLYHIFSGDELAPHAIDI